MKLIREMLDFPVAKLGLFCLVLDCRSPRKEVTTLDCRSPRKEVTTLVEQPLEENYCKTLSAMSMKNATCRAYHRLIGGIRFYRKEA